MPPRSHADWSQFFDVGKDILVATADGTTGGITCQTGNAVDSTANKDSAEIWGPAGYYAVPANPTKGKPSCQALILKCSDYDVVFGTRDPRDAAVVGNLSPGDRVVAGGYPSQSRLHVKFDGSVSLLTTDDNTATGNAVFYRISAKESRFWSPWGSQVHDATGYHARTFHGAKLDLGGLGLPAPFSAFGSMGSLSADMIFMQGALVSLGLDQGLTMAVVQALPLQTVLAALATALTTLATALGTAGAALVTGGSGGTLPTLSTGESTAGAALNTASLAFSAAITALGTITTACATKATVAA